MGTCISCKSGRLPEAGLCCPAGQIIENGVCVNYGGNPSNAAGNGIVGTGGVQQIDNLPQNCEIIEV